ncbi:MAG: MBL fold metallo-hydrolase [Acidobacteria bacterium]|nr:MBL fold metallo-hydrolase [Acidobacteriota bacterium]
MDRLPPFRSIALLIALSVAAVPLLRANAPGHPADNTVAPAALAVATYAGSEEQVRSVRALVRSLRERGGAYRDSVVHVVLTDPDRVPGDALRGAGVELVPLALEPAVLDYPLALKAFAAAEVERRVRGKAATLAWLDPGVLILQPPAALDLGNAVDATVRPVSLANTVGIPPGAPPDAYWAPIYAATHLDFRALPAVETVVDAVPVQPYYNCEVYALNPELGICEEWGRILAGLLNDPTYQQAACTTFLKRLFLHQAVLSAVLQSRVAPDRLRPLPLTAGYPFNQHAQLAPERRAASLDAIAAVIFDTAWQQKPDWLGTIPVSELLRTWLSDIYIEYLGLADGVYRIEGSCNAYLVTTADGSLLIDPAGADVAPEYFRRLLARHPLQAMLLTHAHEDHAANATRRRALEGLKAGTHNYIERIWLDYGIRTVKENGGE